MLFEVVLLLTLRNLCVECAVYIFPATIIHMFVTIYALYHPLLFKLGTVKEEGVKKIPFHRFLINFLL